MGGHLRGVTLKRLSRESRLLVSCIGSVLVYAVLVVATTWPVVRAPCSRIVVGTEPASTVPLFNAWTIWWNADRAVHGFRGYFDAPIFHPTEQTFLLSELQLPTVLVAPAIWWLDSPALAHNLWLWLSLVFNGVFAERLLCGVGVRRSVAVGGGAAMVLLPIVHWQLGVLQLVPVWGILWTWSAMVRATHEPSLVRGALVGLAFSVAYHLCGHHGLFLAAVLAGGAVVVPGSRALTPPGARCWGAALGVGMLLVGPFAWRQAALLTSTDDFVREEQLVEALSLEPGDYTAGTWRQLVEPGSLASTHVREERWGVGPGWIKAGLACLGLYVGLCFRRRRRWTVWIALVGGLALLLSLGPNLDLFGWRPWRSLVSAVPGFAQVRNVFRFAYFVQMAVVLLAAVGVHGLSVWRPRFGPDGWRRFGPAVLAVSLGLLAVFEMPPAPPDTTTVPSVERHRAWVHFLRENAAPTDGVACLPFAEGWGVADFEVSTRWMYLGTFHGRPLANGYSGFFPERYHELRQDVREHWPGPAALEALHAADVRWIVVDRELRPRPITEAHPNPLRLVRVHDDPVAEVTILRLDVVATGTTGSAQSEAIIKE